MELMSLKQVSKESKIKILKALGYDSDGIFVIDKNGSKVIDRYIEQPVKLDNMILFPGSTIVLDDNELSIAAYIEEYGDIFNEF